jgi:hypothetical protein
LLCGLVLFLEGYDIAAVGYAIPSLVDAWRVDPSVFTEALVAGNVGLVLGSTGAGLPGDQAGRRPVLICCVTVFGIFSLLSALVESPMQLASLRLLTGLGLGGGIPLAVALVSDLAPPTAQGRVVILMAAGVPIGFTLGGLVKPACALVRMACDIRARRRDAACDGADARAAPAGVHCAKQNCASAQSGRSVVPGRSCAVYGTIVGHEPPQSPQQLLDPAVDPRNFA